MAWLKNMTLRLILMMTDLVSIYGADTQKIQKLVRRKSKCSQRMLKWAKYTKEKLPVS